MPHIFDMPKRIISMLKQLKDLTLGFGTDQLPSCVADRNDGKKGWRRLKKWHLISFWYMILVKLSTYQITAKLRLKWIKPYVSDDAYHIIRTHQDFSGREHYYHHMGKPQDLRKQYENVSLGIPKQLNLPTNGIKQPLIQSTILTPWNHLSL